MLLEYLQVILQEHCIEALALILSLIGGVIGLRQWVKGNDYKRAEITKELITQIRDDKEIAFIMDLIDWPDNFTYDGKFHMNSDLNTIQYRDEQELFIAMDRTLAHFNYICYLYTLKIFNSKDMAFFEYAIRRLFDNKHICNYLHSLTLWSAGLRVECSYSHLVLYGAEMGYISNEFYDKSSSKYDCFLRIE